MYQDIVITVVSILFTIFLIPQLYDTYKNKTNINPYTSGLTCFGMIILAVMYATLDLILSFFTTIMTASIWGLIFVISTKRVYHG